MEENERLQFPELRARISLPARLQTGLLTPKQILWVSNDLMPTTNTRKVSLTNQIGMKVRQGMEKIARRLKVTKYEIYTEQVHRVTVLAKVS